MNLEPEKTCNKKNPKTKKSSFLSKEESSTEKAIKKGCFLCLLVCSILVLIPYFVVLFVGMGAGVVYKLAESSGVEDFEDISPFESIILSYLFIVTVATLWVFSFKNILTSGDFRRAKQ